MVRVVWRGLLQHKLRAGLTALAIVLGVTFVAGTFVLTDTLHATFTSLFSQIYAKVDFQVRGVAAFSAGPDGAPTRRPVPDTLISTVQGVPGVANAEGGVSGYAQLVGPNGKAVTTGGAPTLGVTFGTDPALSPLRLVAGHAPEGRHQMVIDRHTATTERVHVGQVVTVLLAGPPEKFTVAGIATFGTADNLAGATLCAFNLPTAQAVFNSPGKVDAIEVRAARGQDLAALQRSIAAVLPPGFQVVTGKVVADESTSAINTALGFLSTALLVFAGIALFVGAFTIMNTFSITVGQRTRELALLRVIGASRTQVMGSVLGEAAIIGLASSLLGLALGVATAKGLEALLSAFGGSLPQGGLVFTLRTVVVSLVVGLGVTLASAVGPARRAVRIPPIAALSTYQAQAVESSRRRLVVGGLLAAGGIAALAAGLGLPAIQLVGLGAVLIFVAAGMLAPLVARPVSSVVGRPLARLFSVAGRLGRENSMRSPRRTAQTASALMVGLALVSAMSVFGSSLSTSATRSVDQAILADYVITASSPGGPPPGFSRSAVAAAAAVPGVTAASSITYGRFLLRGSPQTTSALAPRDLGTTAAISVTEGAGAAALARGQLLVDTTQARDLGLRVGERLAVTFAETGRQELVVGGIFQPSALLGGYVLAESTFLANNAPSVLPSVLLVSTAGGASPTQTRALQAGLAGYPNLVVRTRAAAEEEQRKQVNQVLGLVYALLMLAVLIAFIGIVNTLMLSVFERTREIGLLRAVGMSRRQVRTMVRTEAVILSVFGALLGVVLGTGLGVALSRSLADQGLTATTVPVGQLVVFVVLAALLGLVAAGWPARRAARLDVLGAISAE